jgi:hypothetical protein
MEKITNTIPANNVRQQKQAKRNTSRFATPTLETHDELVERIGREFIDWCINVRVENKKQRPKEFFDIEDFLIEKKMASGTFDDWYCNKDNFRALVDEGQKYLGIHLFAGVAEKTMEAQQINKIVVRYNKKYKEGDDYILSIEIKKIEARANALQKQLEDVQFEYHSLLKKINDKENTDIGQVQSKTVSDPDNRSGTEL